MKVYSKRNRKIADLIYREVALILKSSVTDPRLAGVMLTTVDLAPDLGSARIYYTLLSPSRDVGVAPRDDVGVSHKQVSDALKKAVGFIRHELAARVDLRYLPKISFHYDESISRAQRILSLMDDVETPSDE